MPRGLRIISILLVIAAPACVQPFSLLIKNGYLIDPANNRHDTVDIAIHDGRIARIAKRIDTREAATTIDVSGAWVTPGLIDIHTHVFFAVPGQQTSTADREYTDREYAGGEEGMVPDSFSFRTGTTTIVDAGSSGWREFPVFKQRVIDHSKTRVLAFMNIVGSGMRGGHYEQDTLDMDGQRTAARVKEFSKNIVGIKVAHYRGADWHPVDEAVKAGRECQIPVMIDFGGHLPPLSIQALFFEHLRPGDIFTHCFAALRDRQSVVDTSTKTLRPFIFPARQKGIVFDLGYGEISFALAQAIPAVKNGFLPNSISTDIHASPGDNIAAPDHTTAGLGPATMPYIMSLFLTMGLPPQTVVRMATSNPAKEIGRPDLGQLSIGAIADIAVLRPHHGHFTFTDHAGHKITGDTRLECEMTIKDGKIVYKQ